MKWGEGRELLVLRGSHTMHLVDTWGKTLEAEEREMEEEREKSKFELGNMSNQVVRVKRETIAACMTCPLCNKLFRNATTISECLHTFCRKCIRKKLLDEELECCPVCNIDLGCVPLEKLRPDHNLQDIRNKIFPPKQKSVQAPEAPQAPEVVPQALGVVPEAPEVIHEAAEIIPEAPEDVPSATLPSRRKERSLSSLVVSTPRVSTQTTMTGRRSKVTSRKKSRGSSFSIERPVKKEENSEDDHQESSSSRETLNKFTQSLRLTSSITESSNHPLPDKAAENGTEPLEGKVDLWKPLNYLVEVANRSKSSKFTSQGSNGKSETPNVLKTEAHIRKHKGKDHLQKIRVPNERSSIDHEVEELAKPKKIRRARKKITGGFGQSGVNLQAVLDAAPAWQGRRTYPIWLSLMAAEDQEGSPLPQLSARYLRIKNGNATVSFLQKFLVTKLDLTSEDEVEIKCMGQSVLPTLQVNYLIDMWLQTMSPSHRVPTTVGSSGKDFVMVLTYARKAPPP